MLIDSAFPAVRRGWLYGLDPKTDLTSGLKMAVPESDIYKRKLYEWSAAGGNNPWKAFILRDGL